MFNFKSINVDVNGRTGGRVKTHCPHCHEQRRNKRDKSLSVDIDRGLCKCHYCGWTAKAPDTDAVQADRRRRTRERNQPPAHFKRPRFDDSRLTLSPRLEEWFVRTRCIPQQVLAEMRITEQAEFLPQVGAKVNCVCFNYFENGELVNTKFRDGAKNFKLVKDAELIPYNIDGIQDTPEAIITEGEIDALSFMAIGRRDVVSAPAGATNNLSWLDRFVETHFDDKLCIYIAVDSDAKGVLFRQELIRRLGAERCRIVHYGPECKDANEHLVKYGASSLETALAIAQEVPLEGVYTADDLSGDLRTLYENGLTGGAETGWSNLDNLCTFELRRLAIVSGVPGDGKSEFVDELVLRLCLRHEWKIAFFSPENVPITYHLRKLAEKLTSKPFQHDAPGMTEALYAGAQRYLTANITHILPEREEFTLDVILSKAHELVARRGIRILVIDPLNRVQHDIPQGMTETQYLSTVLNRLSAFAVAHCCLVILVAHPRKMNRNPITNKRPVTEMYDIYGSAEFFNKTDFGIVVERDREVGITRIHVQKVKFKHLGQVGVAAMQYNVVSGRYSPCEELTDLSIPANQRVINTEFSVDNWLPEAEGELFSDE